MNKSLTVVLPIHNAEHSLRRSVADVLDASADLSGQIQVLIVDDGPTDDSFDIACELATRYPQVRVLRQAQQRGLGPTLQAVRRRVTTDVVMVHDGVTPIRSEQLLALWRQQVAHHPAGTRANEAATLADLRRPAQIHPAMADALPSMSATRSVSSLRACCAAASLNCRGRISSHPWRTLRWVSRSEISRRPTGNWSFRLGHWDFE